MRIIIFQVLTAIFIGLPFTGYSQTVVCGADTVVFELDNYQFGRVQWQESYDLKNWTLIENAMDASLRYYTHEQKYIRAQVIFSACEPITSFEAFIQQKPGARAGSDRKVGNTKTLLTGNYVQGAVGHWSLANGSGGSVFEQDSLKAVFEGEYNNTYELVWTNTNQCGSNSDTVRIEMVETEINNNFIIVDETDVLKSSETELADGLYKIEFSEVISDVDNSSILVGIAGEGFLRKITSFEQIDDYNYEFQTGQGHLEDIFLSGVINLGDDVAGNEEGLKSGHTTMNVSARPTRNDILNTPKYQNGIFILNISEHSERGVALKSGGEGSKTFSHEIDRKISLKEGDESVALSIKGMESFTPNFIFNPEFSLLNGLTYLKLGFDNAVFENEWRYTLSGEIEHNLLTNNNKKVVLAEQKNYSIILVYGLPVVIVKGIEFGLTPSVYGSGSVNLDLKVSKQFSFSAYTEYHKGESPTGVLDFDNSPTGFESQVYIDGTVGLSLTLEPKVSMKVYGVFGPFFSVPLKMGPSLCGGISSNGELAWDAEVSYGVDVKLGCVINIPAITKYEIAHTWPLFKRGFKIPSNIAISGGNNQHGSQNEKLEWPLAVRVTSSTGFGVPLVPVWFEMISGDGTLDKMVVLTNLQGYAENGFTMGNSTQQNVVKVYAQNCSFDNLKGAPVYFNVYPPGGNASCQNSSLGLQTMLKDGYVSAKGVLGTPPYAYSQDGTNFFDNSPQLTPAVAANTLLYVKDANNCMATAMYQLVDICKSSGLTLSVSNSGNNAYATGANGMPPYLYSLNSQNNFAASGNFSGLPDGTHVIYVKDSNGCIEHFTFSIGQANDNDWPTDSETMVIDVLNPTTGKTWMDRNLGASRAATSGTDVEAYGDLYQWGRAADGHQKRNSGTTSTLSSSDTPGHGSFITINSGNYDWRSPQNHNLWQGVNGINNPCPSGYRLPTDAELNAERLSWSSNNVAGAFASPLKLPLAGYRNDSGGSLGNVGFYGFYWSSTVAGIYSRNLYFNSSNAYMYSYYRANGYSVRCLKD